MKMIFVNLVRYSILMSFVFLVGLSANADTSILDKIMEKNIIRVGTTGDFIPFSYFADEQPQQYRGIDIELAKDLANTLGVELELVPTSWPTLMDDLMNNEFDIGMSGISINLDRQKVAMFSEPILSGGKVVITRDENAFKFTTIDQINQPTVKVIFNPGGTNEQFARENFPKAQLILNEDNITIFAKIVSGEADLMVTDAIETIIQQEIHPELEAVNPDKPFNYTEKGYMFRRDVIFKTYVDQWVHLRLNDGTFKTIYDEQINNYSKQSN